MADLFLSMVNISLTASWMALAVILVRFIFRKAPRWLYCLLWGLVGLRLVMPFSLQSVFSLVPSREPIPDGITVSQSPQIDSGFDFVDNAINPIISDKLAPTVGASVNPIQIISEIAAIVWLCGVIAMLAYAAVSYARIYRRVRPSVLYRDNIFFCDDIDTPFILGILRPKIYVPSGISDGNLQFVIEHENAHLRRKDQLSKPLGFLLLSVYWFNPVLWLAYVLLCRDIEKACDERVIKEMSDEARKGYSEALVACSVHRRAIMACPLAFGEVGVKDRIRSVLSYKKPTFWIIVAALVISMVVAVCFMTDPFETGAGINNTGIIGFSVSENEDGGATLKFDYCSLLSYNVKKLKDNWEIYASQNMSENNRLKNTVISIEVRDGFQNSKDFLEKYAKWTEITSTLRMRAVRSRYDTIYIYIHSMWNMSVEEKKNVPLGVVGGSFEIDIELDSDQDLMISDGIRIISYGSNAKDIAICPKGARLDYGSVMIDLLWTNYTNERYDIGKNFKVYRFENGRWTQLKRQIYRDFDSYFVTRQSSVSLNYNLSLCYDLSKPGIYRFEAYGGAWVIFEKYDNELETAEITRVTVLNGKGETVEISDESAIDLLVERLGKLSGEYCGNSTGNDESVVYSIHIHTSDDYVTTYTLQENNVFTVEKNLIYVSFRPSRDLWRDPEVKELIQWLDIYAGVYNEK